MNRRVVAFALGCLVALAAAGPVAAGPGRTAIAAVDSIRWDTVDWGTGWTAGGMQHVRGWTALYDTTGGSLMTGTSRIVANWNVDEQGDGTMWGTTDLALASGTGGWHETWVAKWDDGAWSGWGVGRGFGSLAGMQVRFDVWATGPGIDMVEGFVFDPGT